MLGQRSLSSENSAAQSVVSSRGRSMLQLHSADISADTKTYAKEAIHTKVGVYARCRPHANKGNGKCYSQANAKTKENLCNARVPTHTRLPNPQQGMQNLALHRRLPARAGWLRLGLRWPRFGRAPRPSLCRRQHRSCKRRRRALPRANCSWPRLWGPPPLLGQLRHSSSGSLLRGVGLSRARLGRPPRPPLLS